MDGTFAVIFLLAGIGDMIANDCETSCLGPREAPARIAARGSGVFFQEKDAGRELFLGYDRAVRYGPFQPAFGASLTDDGSLWVGYGAKWQAYWGPAFLEASLLPGLQARGEGPDLGTAVQFRSGVAFGHLFDNGASLALTLDHRSNAGVDGTNPGLETIGLRYSITLD